MLRRRATGAAIFVATFLATALVPVSPARAADDPVAAEALFAAARDLIDKGDWAGGCPKFDVSVKLHASSSTYINIGRCRVHDGKIATAWQAYSRALAIVRETEGAERQRALEEIATTEQRALEPLLPRLRIVVESPPPGLIVTRDGAELPEGALGETLPGDAGPHQIVARAPGFRTETRDLTLIEGKSETLTIALTPDAAPLPVESAIAPKPEGPPSRAVWPYAVGGLGVVLGGVGIAFLVDDLSASRALRQNCFSDARGQGCRAGYDFNSDNARKDRSAPLAVLFGGAGVAALGVAAYGFLAPKRDASNGATAKLSPWIGASSAGIGAAGSF